MNDEVAGNRWSRRISLAAVFSGLLCTVFAAAPVCLGQIIHEDLKLVPSDGDAYGEFGYSIGIENGIVAIGSQGDDSHGLRSGAAYLFDAVSGAQLDKLIPNDSAENDAFGFSIAIDGDIIAVGAVYDDDNGSGSGSAYLFDRASGEQMVKLLPNDGAQNDRFGASIAIDNGIVAVGAVGHDGGGDGAGAAYLFDASTGVQLAKLLADDAAVGDGFGSTVAICNGVVAVGASRNDDNGDDSGSAYLFDVATREQMAKLLPSDGAADDRFGISVALNDSIAAVGALWDDDHGDESGSAYLFDVSDGSQIVKLAANDGAAGSHFGWSIAIDEQGLVVIGAHDDEDNGMHSGSAYVFDASTSDQLAKLLPSDGAADDRFGIAVAIDQGAIAVGAHGSDDNGVYSGSAYVFDANSIESCFDLAIDQLFAGQETTWTLSGLAPRRRAAVVYGLRSGQTNVSNFGGYCASFDIKGVNESRLIGQPIADANGEATLTKRVPGGTSGIRVLMQAAERGTCPQECMSNLLDMVIG